MSSNLGIKCNINVCKVEVILTLLNARKLKLWVQYWLSWHEKWKCLHSYTLQFCAYTKSVRIFGSTMLVWIESALFSLVCAAHQLIAYVQPICGFVRSVRQNRNCWNSWNRICLKHSEFYIFLSISSLIMTIVFALQYSTYAPSAQISSCYITINYHGNKNSFEF